MKTWRNSKQGKNKHIPQRTCIACRKTQDKRSLIRLVNTPESNIEVDSESKMAGRGAYLCKDIRCWEEGLKGSRLEHALRTGINQENSKKLLDWIKEYLDGI